MENIIMSSEDEKQKILRKTKPVLKKTTYHLGNNVILMFKSVEIYFIEDL